MESQQTCLETVATDKGPKAIGPYTQAQIAPAGVRTVYVSGNIGVNPETSKMVEGGVTAQAEQALTNIENVLAAAGTNPNFVTKCTVYLRVSLLDIPF